MMVLVRVQALVLGETIEVFVPVCYAICFTLAYIGPNAKVMGNVSYARVGLFTFAQSVQSSFHIRHLIQG